MSSANLPVLTLTLLYSNVQSSNRSIENVISINLFKPISNCTVTHSKYMYVKAPLIKCPEWYCTCGYIFDQLPVGSSHYVILRRDTWFDEISFASNFLHHFTLWLLVGDIFDQLLVGSSHYVILRRETWFNEIPFAGHFLHRFTLCLLVHTLPMHSSSLFSRYHRFNALFETSTFKLICSVFVCAHKAVGVWRVVSRKVHVCVTYNEHVMIFIIGPIQNHFHFE